MDPRLLEYYNRELQFMREMGAEFAQTYPRIAARLGLSALECDDPYVERLLEGFAFLAARVQLKIDARHPDFTQHLLQMVYPEFLDPIPACAMAEFVPDLKDTALGAGLVIPRGSSLRTLLAKGDRTACEFRTAQDVTLWPLTLSDVKYFAGAGALSSAGIAADPRTRSALRLRFRVSPGMDLRSLPLRELRLFVKAPPDVAGKVHEQVMANALGLYVRSTTAGATVHFRGRQSLAQVGLGDDEALLPVSRSGFPGYRLLQEYFAFAERFLFFAIQGLEGLTSTMAGDEFEVFIAFDRVQSSLENTLEPGHFRLFATPIVNLFPREVDRMHLTAFDTEHHVVPDRNRPMDFEIHSIQRVAALEASGDALIDVEPFYAASHRTARDDERTYYTLQRRQRLYSNRQVQGGARSNYIGTEVFLSITDSRQRALRGELRQIDVKALCTNRDLPIQAPMGKGRTDFILDDAGPIEAVRCISGPTYPRASPAFGDTAWRLISHLSLNYLSLLDTNPADGAEMLREMLSLYADVDDSTLRRQIDGVRSIAHRPIVRRLPNRGPISYGRGLQIDLVLDDAAFEGAGILVLGTVLERFFAAYVSINSYTQLRLFSQTRGEIKQWPVLIGNRQIL
jgi:type VI secretion system protein ImpG